MAAGCPTLLAGRIPDRVADAPAGSEILASVVDVEGARRDSAFVDQVLAGNVPAFLRRLVPVEFAGTLPSGAPVAVTLCVAPDYLAVGNDSDFVRVPLGLSAAAKVARELGFLLPTPKMVDVIYDQAHLRLKPRPMTPSAQMSSTDYLRRHNLTLEDQRKQAHSKLAELTGGHKKDIVLTQRLRSKPGRVAIYGWHQAHGRPIQPLSTVHGAGYADYSHGVRLVSQTAFVNGVPTDLADVLASGELAGLVSGEGPIADADRLLAGLY